MKNVCVWLPAASLVILLMCGCSTQRIIWSPDGGHAAVLGENGLYFCDEDGKCSGPQGRDIFAVSWFADSRRLALISKTNYNSWPELEKALDPAERARIQHYAESRLQDMKAGRPNYPDDDLSDNERAARSVYLKSVDGIQGMVPNWDSFQKIEATLYNLRTATFSNGRMSLGPIIFRTLLKLDEDSSSFSQRVSPDGRAIVLAADCKDLARLIVVSVDEAWPPQIISEAAAPFPDWTQDSRSLVFVRTLGLPDRGSDFGLGCLTRREIFDSNGMLKTGSTNEDLAGLLFDGFNGVRCLSDGRILFSALEVSLPATAQDMPEHPEVFVCDTQRQSTLCRITPKKAEEQMVGAGFVDLSPDGKKLLISGKNGAVWVLNLINGDVTVVQNSTGDEPPSFPSWRGTEVCFLTAASTNSSSRKWEVALWKDGRQRIISDGWPKEVRQDFLDK